MTAPQAQSILHVSNPEKVDFRDEILKAHGYAVTSTLSMKEALTMAAANAYAIVMIDVQAEGLVPASVELCGNIKKARPGQKVVFVCNYRVSVHSDCPDDIIRSEFNPKAMVDGVKAALDHE